LTGGGPAKTRDRSRLLTFRLPNAKFLARSIEQSVPGIRNWRAGLPVVFLRTPPLTAALLRQGIRDKSQISELTHTSIYNTKSTSGPLILLHDWRCSSWNLIPFIIYYLRATHLQGVDSVESTTLSWESSNGKEEMSSSISISFISGRVPGNHREASGRGPNLISTAITKL
jgi:hypothetical protein